jgi:hypothetical protein
MAVNFISAQYHFLRWKAMARWLGTLPVAVCQDRASNWQTGQNGRHLNTTG